MLFLSYFLDTKKVTRGRTPALATFNMEAHGFGTEPMHLDYITLLLYCGNCHRFLNIAVELGGGVSYRVSDLQCLRTEV